MEVRSNLIISIVEIYLIARLWISLLLFSIRLCRPKIQYPDWLIGLSLRLTVTVTEFCVRQL